MYISANKAWFVYFLLCILKSFFSSPAKTIMMFCTCIIWSRPPDWHHISLADGKRWLSECLLTKMNLNNLSISASSCDQAGWAPAVTLSIPRQKTNFFLELCKPRCNLMRGRFLRVSVWELFASFSNYTFVKLTITSAFSLPLWFLSLFYPLHISFVISYQLVIGLMDAAWIPSAEERCRENKTIYRNLIFFQTPFFK